MIFFFVCRLEHRSCFLIFVAIVLVTAVRGGDSLFALMVSEGSTENNIVFSFI